ncbi:MAG: hypothetical protein NT147_10570, partial [Candidatus Aminicenantes bacterium]|nr:hypothetical protein [Candidatus Aminicenantes bacterium]
MTGPMPSQTAAARTTMTTRRTILPKRRLAPLPAPCSSPSSSENSRHEAVAAAARTAVTPRTMMPDLDLEKTRPSPMNAGTSPRRSVHWRLSWPNQRIFCL